MVIFFNIRWQISIEITFIQKNQLSIRWIKIKMYENSTFTFANDMFFISSVEFRKQFNHIFWMEIETNALKSGFGWKVLSSFDHFFLSHSMKIKEIILKVKKTSIIFDHTNTFLHLEASHLNKYRALWILIAKDFFQTRG